MLCMLAIFMKTFHNYKINLFIQLIMIQAIYISYQFLYFSLLSIKMTKPFLQNHSICHIWRGGGGYLILSRPKKTSSKYPTLPMIKISTKNVISMRSRNSFMNPGNDIRNYINIKVSYMYPITS